MKGQMMVGGGLETAETERTRKMGATWSATQVGLRPFKAGLGGHDAGVSGVDAGVENASIPLLKRGRMAMSGLTTFSDFRSVENENYTEKHNHLTISCCFVMFLTMADTTSRLSAEEVYYRYIGSSRDIVAFILKISIQPFNSAFHQTMAHSFYKLLFNL